MFQISQIRQLLKIGGSNNKTRQKIYGLMRQTAAALSLKLTNYRIVILSPIANVNVSSWVMRKSDFLMAHVEI